jgi:uncharacterized membrane protein YheB (UPF0754 family)
VPKNQARLARAIGKTVGDRLLTQEDLTRTLGNPEFRAAFRKRLDDILERLLETERGRIARINASLEAEQARAESQGQKGKGKGQSQGKGQGKGQA